MEALGVPRRIVAFVIPAGYTLALTVQGKDYQYGTEVKQVGWFTMTGVGPFKHDDPTDRPSRGGRPACDLHDDHVVRLGG